MIGIGCAQAPSLIRSGHLLIADPSYDGENVAAFVAVEGVQVDVQPDPPAQVEVRRVRECGTGRHIPHFVGLTAAKAGPNHQLFVLPAGVFWGRYLESSIFVRPGPDCIVAVIGFPTYDPKTGEGAFLEADVELRRREPVGSRGASVGKAQ